MASNNIGSEPSVALMAVWRPQAFVFCDSVQDVNSVLNLRYDWSSIGVPAVVSAITGVQICQYQRIGI